MFAFTSLCSFLGQGTHRSERRLLGIRFSPRTLLTFGNMQCSSLPSLNAVLNCRCVVSVTPPFVVLSLVSPLQEQLINLIFSFQGSVREGKNSEHQRYQLRVTILDVHLLRFDCDRR